MKQIFLLIFFCISILELQAQTLNFYPVPNGQNVLFFQHEGGITYDLMDGSGIVDACSGSNLYGLNLDTTISLLWTKSIQTYGYGYVSPFEPYDSNQAKFIHTSLQGEALTVYTVDYQTGYLSPIQLSRTNNNSPKFLFPKLSNFQNGDWMMTGSFYNGDFHFGNQNLTLTNPYHNYYHGFISKFSDNSNQVEWSKLMTGHVFLTASETSADGVAYASGSRYPKFGSLLDTFLIAGDANAATLDMNGFIAKIDTSGQVMDFYSLFVNNPNYVRIMDMHMSTSSYYLLGEVRGTAQFRGNYTVNVSNNQSWQFIAKYALDTDSLLWVMPSTPDNRINSQASILDNDGNIIIPVRTHSGNWIVGNDTTDIGNITYFIAKLDPDGHPICIYPFTDQQYVQVNRLEQNDEGKIFALNEAHSNIWPTDHLYRISRLDSCQLEHVDSILVGYCYSSVEKEEEEINIKIFPNPTLDNVQVEIEQGIELNNVYYQVFNTNGQLLLQRQMTQYQEQVDLQGFPVGLYFINITTPLGIYTEKVTKY